MNEQTMHDMVKDDITPKHRDRSGSSSTVEITGLALLKRFEKIKQKMVMNNIKNIEKTKLRKEIYLLERNLILFDEMEKLKDPNYFLDHERESKKAALRAAEL